MSNLTIEDIKKDNLQKILNKIREMGLVSRAELSRITGLSRSTCSLLVEELLKDNYIIEKKKDCSSGGRRPVLLELNNDYGRAIGVKILKDKLLAAVIDMNGKVISSQVQDIENTDTVKKHIESLKFLVNEILNSTESKNIVGIGIAVSGRVDQENGIVIESSILNWKNVNLKEEIQNQFNIPIFVENDVNSFAIGELYFGQGKKKNNFICLTVGEGIGLGIVINGQLYNGVHHSAGEFGHNKIMVYSDSSQPSNFSYMEKGSVESFTADYAIINWLNDRGKNYNCIEKVRQDAVNGDKDCLNAFEQMGFYLGFACSNIINLLDPEFIILGGEGSVMSSFFLPKMKKALQKYSVYGLSKDVKILPVEQNDDLWVRGVATLVIQNALDLKNK